MVYVFLHMKVWTVTNSPAAITCRYGYCALTCMRSPVVVLCTNFPCDSLLIFSSVALILIFL